MASDKAAVRRRYCEELKAEVMAECDVPGASVAKVAMSRGINANVVHRWRQLAREGGQATVAKPSDFVPVAIAARPVHGCRDIEVELRRGAVTMKVIWPSSAAADFAVPLDELPATPGVRLLVGSVTGPEGGDAASVVFDAVKQATAKGIDVLIVDTAGRLQNRSELMDELAKIRRVLGRLNPEAPHDVVLVLDATTGQNALNQAVQFHEAIGVTGLALTKLDGTARGGIVLAIARRLGLPIRYIGVGEGLEDLREFVAADYVSALLDA